MERGLLLFAFLLLALIAVGYAVQVYRQTESLVVQVARGFSGSFSGGLQVSVEGANGNLIVYNEGDSRVLVRGVYVESHGAVSYRDVYKSVEPHSKVVIHVGDCDRAGVVVGGRTIWAVMKHDLWKKGVVFDYVVWMRGFDLPFLFSFDLGYAKNITGVYADRIIIRAEDGYAYIVVPRGYAVVGSGIMYCMKELVVPVFGLPVIPEADGRVSEVALRYGQLPAVEYKKVGEPLSGCVVDGYVVGGGEWVVVPVQVSGADYVVCGYGNAVEGGERLLYTEGLDGLQLVRVHGGAVYRGGSYGMMPFYVLPERMVRDLGCDNATITDYGVTYAVEVDGKSLVFKPADYVRALVKGDECELWVAGVEGEKYYVEVGYTAEVSGVCLWNLTLHYFGAELCNYGWVDVSYENGHFVIRVHGFRDGDVVYKPVYVVFGVPRTMGEEKLAIKVAEHGVWVLENGEKIFHGDVE